MNTFYTANIIKQVEWKHSYFDIDLNIQVLKMIRDVPRWWQKIVQLTFKLARNYNWK